MPNAAKTIATIEDYLTTVGTGIFKVAEANTEPGSKGGPTEHPVKSVPDNTQKAKEGERAQENTADVKKDQGAAAVDSTTMAKASFDPFKVLGNFAKVKKADETKSVPGSAASDQDQTGTNKQPTGEDPSVETASVKPGKDDPGTKHPARTDNTDLNGGKYANDSLATCGAIMKQAGDELLAQIILLKQGSAQPTVTKAAAAPVAAIDPRLAQLAGWEAAGGQFDKKAADQMVGHELATLIKRAEDDAANVVWFMNDLLKKEAAAQAQTQVRKRAGDADSMPPTGAPPVDDKAMMAAMGGAGGPPPGAGGPPPDAGGPPPGADGGGAEALLAFLAQMGIKPEELLAELQQSAGGADAGGAPPGAGAPPPDTGGAPPMPEAPPMPAKAAADTVTKESAAKQQLLELFNRSKQPRKAS